MEQPYTELEVMCRRRNRVQTQEEKNKEWFDECIEASEKKTDARQNWIRTGQQDDLDAYRRKLYKASKLYRRKENV